MYGFQAIACNCLWNIGFAQQALLKLQMHYLWGGNRADLIIYKQVNMW